MTVFAVMLLAFSLSAEGNGNGGKSKVGGYIGWPNGFNFSHEFTDLVELDMLVGWNGYGFGWGGLTLQFAALFTVYEPTIDTQICPLSIGPALGLTGDFVFSNSLSLDIFVPLRWEVNFKDLPDFNLFIEYGPGVSFYLSGGPTVATFNSRGGLGLRYRIPNSD